MPKASVDQTFLDELLAGLKPADLEPCLLSSSPVRSQPLNASQKSAKRQPLAPRNNSQTLSSAVPVKRVVKHVSVEAPGKENVGLARKPSPPPRKRQRVELPPVQCSSKGTPLVPSAPVDSNYVPQCKQFTRCRVESAQSKIDPLTRQSYKAIHVSVHGKKGIFFVALMDDWQMCEIKMGDTINIVGSFDVASKPAATITRSEGYLILHPDILVSSTKVADSSHCARKAILQEIIRTSGATTQSLLYGNLLHELMQQCLLDDQWDDAFRREKISALLEQNLQTLWTIDLPINAALDEMIDRSNSFVTFSETFSSKTGRGSSLSDMRVKDGQADNVHIKQAIDIEEDVWSPRFGLKGKIDATVNASVHASHAFAADNTKTHPFEIKTGKAVNGMEHRAQTMLYTLLVTDRYDGIVDTGLLYYMRTNKVYKVPASRNELRGLILARNEFATYLHRRMTMSAESFRFSQRDKAMENNPDHDMFDLVSSPPSQTKREALLPEPIDEERSCSRCYVGDACMLFRKAIEGDARISDDDQNPLQELYAQRTGHLNETDMAFFRHWERLISLEEQELVRHRKEIWTMTAEERMLVGRCIANLRIDQSYEHPLDMTKGSKTHRYTYRLRVKHASQWTASQTAKRSLFGGNISVNDPVVVSLEEPSVLAISRGFVLDMTHDSILVGLDHSLIDLPQVRDPRFANIDRIYRLDKDELATGMGRIRDNLIQLFVENGDERRRRLIVQLDKPTFEDMPILDFDPTQYPHLNTDQTAAIDKVCRAQDYALILGMPGTGKTTTIAELIKVLVKNNKTVLLSSYTHSAVDNILLKLVGPAGSPSVLRLGNRDKIMPALHKYTLEQADSSLSMHQLDRLLMEPSVVATTCLSINEPIFTRRHFDYCIVDEASQVTLPACIGPLRYADKFILVGDHKQLPPLVRNQDARSGGLETSLFKLLSEEHPNATVHLSYQYRMNADIMHLSNKLVYDNDLKAGNTQVASRQLAMPKLAILKQLHSDHHPCWLLDILSPERQVVFVNTDKCPALERKQGSLIDNETEAMLCAQTTEALVASGVDESQIGIITLYRQQIKTVNRHVDKFADVEVLTADRSQGRDKECIIMSLVRSNAQNQSGDLLKDWRRINVCLTRAKSKLIIFGSRSTLAKVLEPLFKIIEDRNWGYELPANSLQAHAHAT